MMITPFFPALRAHLAAQRRPQSQALRQIHFPLLVEQLRALLPVPLLSSEDEGTNSRDRIFSLRLTFECFVWQVLKPATSCREVVRAVQALFKSLGLGPVDEASSAFVQARQRLPTERLERALVATAQVADRRVGEQSRLNGRPVKVADCSTTQLPDTKSNQKRYPQPSSQKPGCGFPVLKFLVLFSLSSGAILRVATGHWRNHDVRLLRGLFAALPKGDILLGDRAYGDYLTMASLPKQGVDVVARLHGGRKVDYRKAVKRLGRHDGLFEWSKPYERSKLLTAAQWRKVPETIVVRLICFDAVIRGRKQRVRLVTTLLDPLAYPAPQLAALYARRWHLELALRHLKTSMGMEVLRCQSPDMAEKELLAYLVAYNLIRCLMAEAVALAGVEMERLSFKGSVDAVRQYTSAMYNQRGPKRQRALWNQLLATVVKDQVPLRPHRNEPRAVKRRPKAYQLLNQPRHRFKEVSHRCRYRKSQPPKNRALI
jgi:hypothetical protein